MIEHLSAAQISEWMIGERTPQLEQHVAQCPECSAELKKMEAALSQFRSSMRDPRHAPAVPEWREPAPSSPWFTWSRMLLAAAVLLILVAMPVWWRAHVRQQETVTAAAALADSQLLERVDSAISQAIPEPMEPLVTLVTWNSNAADGAQKVSR
jgi:anti-sigma factor RsiW